MQDDTKTRNDAEFKSYAIIRVVIALVLIVAMVWGLTLGLDYLDKVMPRPDSGNMQPAVVQAVDSGGPDTLPSRTSSDSQMIASMQESPAHPTVTAGQTTHESIETNIETNGGTEGASEGTHSTGETATAPAPAEITPKQPETAPKPAEPVEKAAPPAAGEKTAAPAEPPAVEEHAPAVPAEVPEPHAEPLAPGVAFIQAAMEPLEYELNHRWWGWRPNDIVNITDNVNYYQMGVLEVTRRTLVQLAERISRTGSTDAFNRHLENAMNWVMVSPDRYWFPSPESKYKDSLNELEAYKKQLTANKATFYTRSDNIIPLLAAFEDLLGSCDENLVKATEKDGSKVSFFSTDNYFYYAKGIASAMATILESVHEDFTDVLEKRNGVELLHHAIESCHRAAELDPWVITNGDLDGILANHRANMAAPISHAKFYLGQLIKTLST